MNSHPYFPSLLSDVGGIQPTRSAQIILDMCEFCVNWGGESHALLRGVNKFTFTLVP